jgi:hypothetical protein
MCHFFFVNIKRVHQGYRNFYESENEDGEVSETDTEDTTEMAPTETAARFYFELSFTLAGEDLTKIEQLNKTNMYLCLNTASLIKDRLVKEQEELKKARKSQNVI